MESPDYKKRMLLEAFSEFRMAMLIYFIGLIIILIAFGVLIGALAGAGASLTAALGLSAVSLALLVVGGIVLLASFIKLYSSGGKFEAADPRLSGLKKGMQLAIIAVILLILGGVVGYASPFAGFGLIAIAGILGLIAQILVGLFFMRLADLEHEGIPVPSGFRTVGILYLIGIVIGILQLIALILAYMYSGDAIRRLSAEAGSGEALSSPTVSTY